MLTLPRWCICNRLRQLTTWFALTSVPLFVVGIAWVFWLIGASGREHLWQYTWAAFWSSGGGIFWDWSNYWIAGQRVQMGDLQAYDWLRTNVYHGRSWLRLFDHFVWTGFVAWLATIAALWWHFSSSGLTDSTVQVKLQLDNPGQHPGPTYGGAATITATAIGKDSRGVDGRTVVMSTTRGSLSPTTGTTNGNGQFSSTFRADSEPPGTLAEIMTTIDGVTQRIYFTIY